MKLRLAGWIRLLVLLQFTVISSCALLAADTASRERVLLDFDWRFHLGDPPDAGDRFDYPEVEDLAKTQVDQIGLGDQLAAGVPDPVAVNLGGDLAWVKPGFDAGGWRQLDLPHDWAVELPFDPNADLKHGFKPVGPGFRTNSIGWYRRSFELPASDRGRSLWIEFDGVYRNALVWLNGRCLGRHLSGYGSFRYDISQVARFGGTNELVVRVDASRFEGWFYEGAGIYRHVWLVKTSPVHVAPDGVFVYTRFDHNVPEGEARIHVESKLLNTLDTPREVVLRHAVMNPGGRTIASTGQPLELRGLAEAQTGSLIRCSPERAARGPSQPGEAVVRHTPELWSPESPKLYTLITTVESGGKVLDRVETRFGVRTVAFDANRGFLLNGKPYVIKGTCNHQDHAGVGRAMPDRLQYWRLARLKEMGSNAYRTSHYPPTPELLNACDELGLLVMNEARRMDVTAEALGELERLILRDRNHPSIFMWSLGNEEFALQATNAETQAAAVRVLTPMQQLAHKLDPTRLCTVAMNNNWGFGFSTVVDVQGFNYRTRNIPPFRAAFPDRTAIGTETASTRTTRGIYADDPQRGYVAAYGENGVERPWTWWSYFATNAFTSGGFVWTGFDYRGEPTPYRWPCISSHFGLMDTCGFPKDIYYYYQSWWADRTVLHLAPHWNRPVPEGSNVLVRCFSNCDEVELFVNNRSVGRQAMPRNGYLDWTVSYAPGVLSARGYRSGRPVVDRRVETTGAPHRIELKPDRTTIDADGRDISVVNVAVLDERGRVVPVADNLIQFGIEGGSGKILGVGNGDPSSHEPDKADHRKVFNGLAQVIVQSTREPGTIRLTASSDGLKDAVVRVRSRAVR